MIEFDSTLALPWERRSALEPQFYGYRLCAYTNITSTMQILYVISIGQRHVPLHLMVWWPRLLPVSCFAARLCHCTSIVISVEGHRQTCLPLQESLIAHCVAMTICIPVFEGILLKIPIFFFSGELAMIHRPCQIIPLLSVSLPQHIQAIDLLCSALTGSHWQRVHDIGICWVLIPSDGCECTVPSVHKACYDDILIQPLVIYRKVLQKCHLSSGIGSPHVACLPDWWPIILCNSIARVICPSMYAPNWSTPIIEFVSMQSDTSFLLTSASVFKSNCMMWGTMRYKVQWQHSTSEANGLSGTLSCWTPHFILLRKQ